MYLVLPMSGITKKKTGPEQLTEWFKGNRTSRTFLSLRSTKPPTALRRETNTSRRMENSGEISFQDALDPAGRLCSLFHGFGASYAALQYPYLSVLHPYHQMCLYKSSGTTLSNVLQSPIGSSPLYR